MVLLDAALYVLAIQPLQLRGRVLYFWQLLFCFLFFLSLFFFFSFSFFLMPPSLMRRYWLSGASVRWAYGKPELQVQPHYSVFLARRLHTSGWSISRVINKITLARFWQASVIAANELSTSKINQSWGKRTWFMHSSENRQIIQGIYSFVSIEEISDVSHTHTHTGHRTFENSLIHHANN